MATRMDPATLPEKSNTNPAALLTEQQREEFIRTAAYHLAQQRNFEPGHAEEDWIAAEAQIDALKSADH